MDGWMLYDGRMVVLDGLIVRWIDECLGWLDGWMDGWKNGMRE
jgi:hypothetical protein